MLNLQLEGKHLFFWVVDFVWKNVQPMREVKKLEPRWEGPYKVCQKLSLGAYYVQDQKGKVTQMPLECFLPLTLSHLNNI